MNYTIIGYMSSGEDTCRGCVMSSWSSDFEIYTTTDREEVVRRMADFNYSNLKATRSSGDWEVTLLFNGIDAKSGDLEIEDWEHADSLYREAAEVAKARLDKEIADKAAKAQAEKIAADEAERVKQEKRDLETYNRLRVKFETKE